ncbi:MAG: tetratricopeptide repeat protein [Promethearchaeota archaeon]
MGSSYADTGQHSQALDCFFRALELDNSHVPTLHNLALSWMDLGNHDEAIDILNNALMIESNSSVLLKTLARAHREIGEIEQAAKYENLSSEKKANLTN